MKYHVVFCPPEAAIYEGPGKDEYTYDTFEEAKAVAMASLEEDIKETQEWLKYLRDAKRLDDLPRYKHGGV